MTADEGPHAAETPQSCSIVTVLQSGDREELNRVLAIYRPYLRALAARLIPLPMRGRLDGSDLVQETLLRGTARLDQFRGTTAADFAAWLRSILEHLLIDGIRHHSADKRDVYRELLESGHLGRLPADAASPSQVLRHKEEHARISAALVQLSDEQRQIIELRSQGRSFEEIGELTSRTADAARMVWGRAIKKLMKLLDANT